MAGLPLIHVTTPTLEGGQRVAKRLFDIVVSGMLIVLASPVMAVVACVVKLDSRDPCFSGKSGWQRRASTLAC